MLWRRDLLLFIHIIQAASISRILCFALIGNGSWGPCLSDVCLPWPTHVAPALALAPQPTCASYPHTPTFPPLQLRLASLCASDSFSLENWDISGTFPCSNPFPPQHLANLYLSFRSQWKYHSLKWPSLTTPPLWKIAELLLKFIVKELQLT